jgi:MSHA pilin protein MshD
MSTEPARPPARRRPRPRARGLTLVELILFMMIIAIALGGIITVMNLTSTRSADPVRRKQALIIAEGLLEEIELAKFTYCDPVDPDAGDAAKVKSSADCHTAPEAWGQGGAEPVNTRPYDNVNDYVAAANTLTAAFNDGSGALADANGNALGVTGYAARVRIAPATLGPSGAAIGSAGSAADSEVLRITVQVDYDGQSLVLEGYRTRYAPTSP